MLDRQPTTRRFLLQAGAAALGCAVAAPALAAPKTSAIVAAARSGLARVGGTIPNKDLVGVADFTAPSCEPRFHLVDMATGGVTSFLVAHGRGSDPAHSGWVRTFSNQPGSAASSEGAYRTVDYYVGKHGRSMKLQGLDPTNDNAMARAIVVHGAWYVSPQVLSTHGVLGRSEGCFAFSDTDLPQVLTRLGPGRLIVAGKFAA